jgi:Ca2+-transporting ATPase
MPDAPWHIATVAQSLERLTADRERGLTEAEAARRLLEYGPNELQERGRKGPWRILADQFAAVLVLVLLAAAIISLMLGDLKNAAAILAIVVLNALFGFAQEYRAERAMASLKKMAVPLVRVRRSEGVRSLPSAELVPGDVVLLEAGNIVPGDSRLVDTVNLRVQEAALTGESEPIEKDASHLMTEADAPLGDRRNMVYMGTVVTYGRGEALVVATGMRTELGRIAALMQAARQEPTPLQRRLAGLGRQLAGIALAVVGLISALGLLRGEPARDVFLMAVSMAVAAVPEGLPAVVTIALALGAQRMFRRRALMRKLSAVEALGSVTVICSDKTGTLTENRMTVALLDAPGEDPIDPSPKVALPPAFRRLLAAGALCNDAVMNGTPDGSWEVLGDPTETALVTAAAHAGLSRLDLDRALPRVAEVPFESDRKRMSTVHLLRDADAPAVQLMLTLFGSTAAATHERRMVVTKGAVDRLLDVCTGVWTGDRVEPLDPTWRRWILAANDRAAQRGMRVLGLAVRTLEDAQPEGLPVERDLTFLGIVGLIDPARPEARDAVARCLGAGIRTVMITGDHPLTAESIARDLGIARGTPVVTGPQLSSLGPEELDALVEQTTVYARVDPEHKLRIVQALQRRGHIVAMTGDGVNDAPALKQADIGVAMGITGTDVAKDAANMVLVDDNFATIVAAVEEGRVIFDNIRKFVGFLVASNSAELWVMLLAPVLGMPVPLLPLQILWINLVTDGPAALALGVEPAEPNTMRRPPYRPDESLFSRAMVWRVVWVGGLMAGVCLVTDYWYWQARDARWQTMIFTTLALAQMANVLASRSNVDPLWKVGLWSNKPLLGAVVATVVLQLAVVYVPFLQRIFTTRALGPWDLAVAFALSSSIFVVVEGAKWWRRRRDGHTDH